MTTKTKTPKPSMTSLLRGVFAQRAAIQAAEAPVAAQRTPRRVHRTPRPTRRIDALATLALFAARKPVVHVAPEADRPMVESFDIGRPQVLLESKGRDPVAGVDGITSVLARLTISAHLSPMGNLYYASEAGVLPGELREPLAAVAPLLKAAKAGAPLRCDWCLELATTMLSPGETPACGAHAAEVEG